MEATTGFEPVNSGFADRRLGPLGYVAVATTVKRGSLPGLPLPTNTASYPHRVLGLPASHKTWLAHDTKTRRPTVNEGSGCGHQGRSSCGLRLAGFKVDVPADAEDIDAVRVVPGPVLHQRLGGAGRRGEPGVVVIVPG